MTSGMSDDVLVVGAGPAGLMLAGELALRGVSVTVLEQRTTPDRTVRAGAIHVPTAEAFDRRGLLPEIAAVQEATLERMATYGGGAGRRRSMTQAAGHFGGLLFTGESVDEADPAFAGHGPAAEVRFVNQQQVEEILGGWVKRLGVEVHRGVAVTGFDADNEGVTVHAGERSWRTGWLVGADGGRSLVRKSAGFDFPGTGPEITAYQAVVELSGEPPARGWHATATGLYAYGPAPGRVLSVEFDGAPQDRDAPVTPEEMEGTIRRVSGADVRVTAVQSATRFTDNARQATTYRQGRVLLAGDAAHVHSPFGGQGLNLSVGDAVNLGWKLAAVVAGRPDDLLDTYTAERHPIGAWVLDWTRAQIAVMRPDPYARAMRAVMSDLLGTTDATTYVAKQLAGVTHRYDLGSEHPLVGRSAPDLALTDGRRLNEHLVAGSGAMVDLGGLDGAAPGAPVPVRAVASVETGDAPGLLVRPDGIVAWAGAPDDLDPAVARWFGAGC